MEHLINPDERPEHRAARQRTDEEEAALWFIESVDWEALDRKDEQADES